MKTGLKIAVPPGTYGRVAPRSGLAFKHFIDTGAGVIDEDYRGELGVLLFNHSDTDFEGAHPPQARPRRCYICRGPGTVSRCVLSWNAMFIKHCDARFKKVASRRRRSRCDSPVAYWPLPPGCIRRARTGYTSPEQICAALRALPSSATLACPFPFAMRRCALSDRVCRLPGWCLPY